jgi:hypothetical protein
VALFTHPFKVLLSEGQWIEVINGPFLYQLKGTPAEYKAGLDYAIARGWLFLHESGTYVRFTEAGAALVVPKKIPPAVVGARTGLVCKRVLCSSDSCQSRPMPT